MMKRILLATLLSCSFSAYSQFEGNALDFDGANDMVVCNTVPAVFSSPATNDFTIEAWVNPRGSAFQRIFYAQPSTTNFVSLGTNTGNTIYFYVISNSTTYSVATTSSITQNAWTHVTARWTSASLTPQVFFNGTLQPTIAGGSSSTGTSGLTVLGSRPGGAQYFNGMLDEVRVWSEARTQCEISNNYMHSITGVQINLIMNYDFNQGVPAGNNTGVLTLPDNSGNAYNGNLTNFTLTAATSNWVASTATLTTQGNPLGGILTSQSASQCSGLSYTFPDGSTQTNITSTVVQTSTLTAQNGCDSIITTTVSVLQPTSSMEMVSVCNGDSYTFPDGSTTTNITVGFNHNSTLTNAAGCDSVITSMVSVNQPSVSSQSASVCSGSSYTFPDGSVTSNITTQITEMDTLSNYLGCDSVITTTVDVLPVYSMNDSAAVCSGSSYTFHDGTTYTGITAPTFYTSVLTTISGCDSAITTTVGIISVDTLVSVLNETLAANAGGATYQWLDCGNGYAPLAGETNQSFTATVNGNYAVAITQNGCTDTSSCFLILSTGIAESATAALHVYPNPTNGLITIVADQNIYSTITVVDLSGKVVSSSVMNGTAMVMDLSSLATGSYLIIIESETGRTVQKLEKN